MKNYLALLLLFLSMIFYSCSSYTERNSGDIDISKVKYRVIYVIHGDGSYLYHDSAGKEISADERALEMALEEAKIEPNSEVFIFYLKPKASLLLLFPEDDREIFHYVNGRLADHETYRTETELTNLELETQYFKRHSLELPNDSVKNFFIYYGHQIPEVGGYGYNASYPEMQFNIRNLAKSLDDFSSRSEKFFDLIVLSTCNNGTPGVIATLAPFAKYIVASPEDLHLSYMNNSAFSYLSKNPGNYAPYMFAKLFAETAFRTLEASTNTIITVSLYDIDRVTPFLKRIGPKYDVLLLAYKKSNRPDAECEDCKNHKFFNLKDAESGVEVFYRPPQFGKLRSNVTHSGWGCLKTGSFSGNN